MQDSRRILINNMTTVLMTLRLFSVA